MTAVNGPKVVSDGLVFAMDMNNTQKSWKGKPTTNLLTNNPTINQQGTSGTLFTTTSSYVTVPFITPWYYSRYPNSNLDSNGGVRWDASVEDPLGNYGAMALRMFPGGNSETQLQQYPNWNIDSSLDYTVSVYCKTTQSNTFRIHLNTVKDGVSYWGYASGYHSGSGEWERLSITIPANQGNTKLRTIRCQGIGTTKTAEAYYKYFQVEQSSFATPFVAGTRSNTETITDLTGKNVITAQSLSYNSDNTFEFNGTGNYLSTFFAPSHYTENQAWSISTVVNVISSTTSGNGRGGIFSNQGYQSEPNPGGFGLCIINGDYCGMLTHDDGAGTKVSYQNICQMDINYNQIEMITYVYNPSANTVYAYRNGNLVTSATSSQYKWSPSNQRASRIATSTQGGWQHFFNMKIYDLRVYDRAITPTEIKDMYEATKNLYI